MSPGRSVELATFLRDEPDLDFDYFDFLSAVDRTPKDGGFIFPSALSDAQVSELAKVRTLRAIALWYLSDDEGQTWHEAETWWSMPIPSKTGLQEPGVVERADGTVLSWARTDAGAQYGFASANSGATWSAPIVAAGLVKQFTVLTFQGIGSAIANLFRGNTTAASAQVSTLRSASSVFAKSRPKASSVWVRMLV